MKVDVAITVENQGLNARHSGVASTVRQAQHLLRLTSLCIDEAHAFSSIQHHNMTVI
jgi:hypothetical protein